MGCKVEKNARKIEVKNTAMTIGLQDFNRDVMGQLSIQSQLKKIQPPATFSPSIYHL